MNAVPIRPWEKVFELPRQLFIARVCCVDPKDKEKFWAVEEKIMNKMLDMLESMNKNFLNKLLPFEESQLAANILVAVTINGYLYRALIKRVLENERSCGVLLIDYGSKKKVPFEDIYTPVPIMENTNAFAFCVKSQMITTDLEKNSLVSIQIIQKKTENQFYAHFHSEIAQPKIPIVCHRGPLQVELIKTLHDGRGALFKIIDVNFNWKLELSPVALCDLDSPIENGMAVAVRCNSGYLQRATVFYQMPKGSYAVYLEDEGTTMVTYILKRLKDDYALYPAKVIYLLSKDETIFPNLTKKDRIVIQINKSNGESSAVHNVPCLFQINNDVAFEMLATRLLPLEHKYWREPVVDGSIVHLTRYISPAEVYVSTSYTKSYYDIIKLHASQLILYKRNDIISIGDIVVVICPSNKLFFRGEVQSGVLEYDIYQILNIDTAVIYFVRKRFIRKMERFLTILPLSLKKVKLAYVKDIVLCSYINVERANDKLKRYVTNKNLFYLHNIDDSGEIVQLNNKHTNNSLNRFMVSLIEPIKEGTIKFHDLQRLETSVGDNLAFIVLNPEGIRDGHIIGAHFNNQQALLMIQQYEKMISTYCECAKRSDTFDIARNQLCLAYDSEASKWNRAVVMKVFSSSIYVTVINFDVGTVRKVPRTDILSIPNGLLFPLYSNTYYIKDFSKLTPEKHAILKHVLKPYNLLSANIDSYMKYSIAFSKMSFVLDINIFKDLDGN